MVPKWIQDFVIGVMSLFLAFLLLLALVLMLNGMTASVELGSSRPQYKYVVYLSVLIVFFSQYYLLRKYCTTKAMNVLFSAIVLAAAIWIMIKY